MDEIIFAAMREFDCTYGEAVHVVISFLDNLGEWEG